MTPIFLSKTGVWKNQKIPGRGNGEHSCGETTLSLDEGKNLQAFLFFNYWTKIWNIKKLECSQISKFLRFKMIWSSYMYFEKSHLGGQA